VELRGITAVVTGAARGIGAALVRELKARGAAHVAASDISEEVRQTGADSSHICDVSDAGAMLQMIERIEADHGPIALFCSNAGILNGYDDSFENAAGASAVDWQRAWDVNVMAHVHAAHILLPKMKARGGGHFLQTASAAGLLNQIGSATYATTKHAAIGFAENLAITHRGDGIRVSVLCPQGVNTAMAPRSLGDGQTDGIIEADELADVVVETLREERFYVLPHPEVREYVRRKGEDVDRWLGGMRRLCRKGLDAAAAQES